MNVGKKRPADGYPQQQPPPVPPHIPQAVPRTRKKPTDKTLPRLVEELEPHEFALYNRMREAEARLDATILRKRFDLLDALNRPLKVRCEGCGWLMAVSEDNTAAVEYVDFGSALAVHPAVGYSCI
jgi:hypothetical protein